MSTIFEKIINGEISSEKLFENERIIAIKDIHPRAPVHVLIIPKKVIPNLQSVEKQDLPLMSEIIDVAQQLAKQLNIEDGYRMVVNNGEMAGQEIFHLHFHLLGGKKLGSIG